MYFWSYGLRKRWLDKCLKSPLSEDPSTSKMGNGPKHCWNVKESTLTTFIDTYEGNYGWKSLSEWYAKSYDSFLTHWLPMTSILFLTEAIYCNIFRYNYLRNQKHFLYFILHFLNLYSILNSFRKKMALISGLFLNLRTPKNVVRYMSKKSPFRGPFDK